MQAIEKKHAAASVVIQTAFRRHTAQVHSTLTTLHKLESQLATIAKISAMMPFNVPLDTVLTLMRYCIYIFSHRIEEDKTVAEQNAYDSVLALVLKASSHVIPAFCLFYRPNFPTKKLPQWQVLLSSYVNLTVRDLEFHVAKPETVAMATALVHQVASFLSGSHDDGDGSISGHDLYDLQLGTARLVSSSLCCSLRYWAMVVESGSVANGGDTHKSTLLPDIAFIVKFAITPNILPDSNSEILGTDTSVYKVSI